MKKIELEDGDFCLIMPRDGKGRVVLPGSDMGYHQSLLLVLSFEKIAGDMELHLKQLNDPARVDADLANLAEHMTKRGEL